MFGKKRISSNHRGMTYAEVAVCLFAVATIITPICASLISSTKVRAESETITEVTLNAEDLLDNIKLRMTKDIAAKERRKGNRARSGDPELYPGDPYSRLKYLSTSPGASENLNTLLVGMDLQQKYNISRYAYEVAIWNLNSITTTGDALSFDLNDTALNNASKFHTSTESGMCFDGYSSTTDLVKLDVTSSAAKVFKDRLMIDNFIPFVTGQAYEVRGVSTITVNRGTDENTVGTITTSSALSSLNLSHKNISHSGSIRGYEFTITDSGPPSPAAAKRGNIILDLRQVIRNFNPSLTFKFVNNTGYTVAIKVLRNINKDASPPETWADIDAKIDSQFYIIVDEASTGKAIIERISDSEYQDNYLIAIIVRDKNPKLGQPGKVVKKMVDVYSYSAEK